MVNSSDFAGQQCESEGLNEVMVLMDSSLSY